MATSSQWIVINSKDRIAGVAENFSIDLRDLQNDDMDMSLCIQHLALPVSYYNINGNNNEVLLGTTQTITLTPGNYNATTFRTEFITQASPIYSGVSMSYSSTTGKFQYLGITGGIITANENQGFLGLTTGTHSASVSTISGDRFADLSGPLEVRVITDIPIMSTNSLNANRDVLVSVYPAVAFGSVAEYTNHDFAHIKLRANKLGMHQFSLQNEFGEQLDLNGMNWAMTLLLTYEQ
jgi:hypothetical protein